MMMKVGGKSVRRKFYLPAVVVGNSPTSSCLKTQRWVYKFSALEHDFQHWRGKLWAAMDVDFSHVQNLVNVSMFWSSGNKSGQE